MFASLRFFFSFCSELFFLGELDTCEINGKDVLYLWNDRDCNWQGPPSSLRDPMSKALVCGG